MDVKLTPTVPTVPTVKSYCYTPKSTKIEEERKRGEGEGPNGIGLASVSSIPSEKREKSWLQDKDIPPSKLGTLETRLNETPEEKYTSSPVSAPQPQEGGNGASGSLPSLPPASPPREEEGLWLVKFAEDYPGGLVGSLPGEIPKGTCRILTDREVGELGRKFGFIEVKKLDSIYLNNQSNVQSSPSDGGLIEVLITYDNWKERNLPETKRPPHGTTQLILEFIRKKASRPGTRVRMEELRVWADSIGIPNERLREVLQFLESQGFLRLLKEGSM